MMEECSFKNCVVKGLEFVKDNIFTIIINLFSSVSVFLMLRNYLLIKDWLFYLMCSSLVLIVFLAFCLLFYRLFYCLPEKEGYFIVILHSLVAAAVFHLYKLRNADINSGVIYNSAIAGLVVLAVLWIIYFCKLQKDERFEEFKNILKAFFLQLIFFSCFLALINF